MLSEKGISSLLSQIIMLLTVIGLVSITAMVMSDFIKRNTQTIRITNTFCDKGVVMISFKNAGTEDITSMDVTQHTPEGDSAELWFGEVSPGSVGQYYDTCIGDQVRRCKYTFINTMGSTAKTEILCSEAGFMSSPQECQTAEDTGFCCVLNTMYGDGYRENCVLEHGICDVPSCVPCEVPNSCSDRSACASCDDNFACIGEPTNCCCEP
jgi:hypothetical protein